MIDIRWQFCYDCYHFTCSSKPKVWVTVAQKGNPKDKSRSLLNAASSMLLIFQRILLLGKISSGWFQKRQRNQRSSCPCPLIIEKAREFQKIKYFYFINYAKAFDYVNHNKLWKIFQEMKIPDRLICLLRNLYAGQEATVRTRHGTMDWFQIRKRIHQGCILSPCLFKVPCSVPHVKCWAG